MNAAEYKTHDATGLAALVESKAVTPAELLEIAISCIDETDGPLNAVVHRYDDMARRRVARGLPDGPFTGVPFLLKGTGAALADAPFSSGSALLRGSIASADSVLTSRLLAAGLVPVGRTNVPEFALSFTTEPEAFGVTRNPWDPARTPGGSSGGSAAAVAAGMVPMAHASDGAGSTRVPAAHCGLFGFKPTRMRNPMGPDVAEGIAGMATPHAVTRSVRDSASLLDATSGPDLGDPYAAPAPTGPFATEARRSLGRLRIGLLTAAPSGVAIDRACIGAAQAAARLCQSLGHDVEETSLIHDADGLRHAWRVIAGVNLVRPVAEQCKRARLADPLTLLEPVNAEWVREGRRWTGDEYLAAIGQLHRASRAMGRFFERFDILLSPVTAEPAPLLGHLAGHGLSLDEFYRRFWDHAPFTAIFNASGCPAMSVPLCWADTGLPVGVQFGAGYGQDGTLFGLAFQLEQGATLVPPSAALLIDQGRTLMERSNKTARQMFDALRADPGRSRYGFGRKPMLINVDLQKAYTNVGEFPTAYENDPAQMRYINQLAALARARSLPVVWTYVAFLRSGEDCGVFGSRTDTPDSLQNIKLGSRRAEFDDRLEVKAETDIVVNKKMPSAFHETPVQSLATWHGCDTVIVTGGSTSGCVRATVVDSLSRGYRTIVPEECVADLHESPHYANLYDMMKKYADIVPVHEVIHYYERIQVSN